MSRQSFSSTFRQIARAAAQAERAKQRARAKRERDDRRSAAVAKKQAELDYKEARSEEAAQLNSEAEAFETQIQSLLKRALDLTPALPVDNLYEEYEGAMVDLNAPAYISPIKPSFLARMIPGRAAKYRQAVESSVAEHHSKLEQHRQAIMHRQNSIEALTDMLCAGDHETTVFWLKTLLSRSFEDEVDAISAEIGYSPASNHVVIDLELPSPDIVPEETGYRYTKSADRIDPIIRPQSKRKAIYLNLICQASLKTLDTVFRASRQLDHIGNVTLNSMLETVDPATGQEVRVCLLSVSLSRQTFDSLNLRRVEPQQCLRSLKASVSKAPSELLPVKPIIELDMVDPRFIDTMEVASRLDSRANLMELTPGEFEGLITNLFSAMGLETRQTQASRDGGVDCVAFRTDPIFGGKVVVQAKRYKNTVGVSAVRDLFGTVQNEGAMKGILVTTSGYGQASFDFAKGKPLELLDGGNLLHLLSEHLQLDAKIIMPENWSDL